MTDQSTQEEIERLNKAVDEFALRMKARLAEKAEEGRRGWDDWQYRTGIAHALRADALELNRLIGEGFSLYMLPIDIANYAMMLWWRHMVMKREANESGREKVGE